MDILVRLTLVLFAASLVNLGCGSTVPQVTPAQIAGMPEVSSTTLTVFAAASLTNAFDEIGLNFTTTYPGTEVVFNFAGSNQLATQIGEGAPVDLFASANPTQMSIAIDAGRIISGTQRTFARNRLVIATPSDNPAGLSSLSDLAIPGAKIVLAAAEVPVGRYTRDFLDKAAVDDSLGVDYRDKVNANIVSYETNVRAVLSKVLLGEADAGIVYTSDVAATSGEIHQIEIPDHLNIIASYPIAPLADGANLKLAQQFVDYLLGPEGQQVLVAYGFIPITGDASGAAPGAVPVNVTGLVNSPATLNADALRNIIPTIKPRYWVRGLVSIEVK